MLDFVHSLQNVPAPFNMVVLLAVIGGFVALLCRFGCSLGIVQTPNSNANWSNADLEWMKLSRSSRRLHPVDGNADAFPATRRKTIFSAGPSE